MDLNWRRRMQGHECTATNAEWGKEPTGGIL